MGIKDTKNQINEELVKDKYISSMKRLEHIMRDISETVTEVSLKRCPYRNSKDRCTAKFGCRNQYRNVQPNELFICQDDQKLDYRNAWEMESEP
ncbi:MAG: hypothetical protein CL786_00075 [Chloroflexi bacterium]|nr:hypothetical protein [Chloroflexota bacterium]